MIAGRRLLALLAFGAACAAAQPAAADSVRRAADRSVVAVTAGDRQGTGVTWTGEHVVTASRVVGDASSARIVTSSGRVLEADVRGTHDGLAVLAVQDSGLRAIRTSRASVTSGYVAAGPVGFGARIGAVSVSSRGRGLTVRGTIPSGALGAPVLDGRGRLLGVITRRADGRARAADTGAVDTAVRAASQSDDGGIPWPLVVPLAALLLAGLLVGAFLVRRRRAEQQRRALARLQARGLAAPRETPPSPPAPSVGSNAPTAVQGGPAQAPPPPPPPPPPPAPASDGADDFEIVFRKPREDV